MNNLSFVHQLNIHLLVLVGFVITRDKRDYFSRNRVNGYSTKNSPIFKNQRSANNILKSISSPGIVKLVPHDKNLEVVKFKNRDILLIIIHTFRNVYCYSLL